MYGTPEPECLSSSEYANQLKSSLTDAYEKVRVKATQQLHHQKKLYNKKVHGKPYEVGSHVCSHRYQKEGRAWSGPFVIVKRLSDVTYQVQDIHNRRKRVVVHFNCLKPYRSSKFQTEYSKQPTAGQHITKTRWCGIGAHWQVRRKCHDSPERTPLQTTKQNVAQEEPQHNRELVKRCECRVLSCSCSHKMMKFSS